MMRPHTAEHRRKISDALRGRRLYWTRERLLAWGRALGHKPILTDVLGFWRAVYREFGSLPGFQAVLGYEPNARGRPRKRKEVGRE